MKVWTTRFQSKRLAAEANAGTIVPVRISLGAPKFQLKYPVTEEIRALAPSGRIFRIQDLDEYRQAFTRQLDRIGPSAINGLLLEVAHRHEGQDLALLCFCNVLGGASCHRRIFADWWLEHTGEAILELPEHPQDEYRDNAMEAAQLGFDITNPSEDQQ